MKLRRREDAYGQAVYRQYRGDPAFEMVERDDGFVAPSMGPDIYLAPRPKWPIHERHGLRHARGRVLDIGCNAGRHALWLQERGHDVLGIDVSPLALRTAKLRGLRHTRLLSITEVSRRLGRFDSILMMGNNFGLFGGPERARWLLRRFKGITNEGARIIATSNDVTKGDDPAHTRYHRLNRSRGRLPGQLRIRVRFREFSSPWFDYLMVSPRELDKIAKGTGWHVTHRHPGPRGQYAAILERQDD